MISLERVLNLETIKIESADETFYAKINTKFFNKSDSLEIFNNQNGQASILLLDKSLNKHVQLFFKKADDPSVNYGSISFHTNMFQNLQNKVYEQWFTIFDEPEDDLFDGEIGINDEEKPRVLLRFEIQGIATKNQTNSETRILKENNDFQNLSPEKKVLTQSKSGSNLQRDLNEKKNLQRNTISTSISKNTLPNKKSKLSKTNKSVSILNTTQKESLNYNENLLGTLADKKSPKASQNNQKVKTQNNSPTLKNSLDQSITSTVSSTHQDSTTSNHRRVCSINTLSKGIDKSEAPMFFQSTLSVSSSRADLESIKSFKNDFESQTPLFSAKVLDYEGGSKYAKNIPDMITTKIQENPRYQASQECENNSYITSDPDLKVKQRLLELETEIETLKSVAKGKDYSQLSPSSNIKRLAEPVSEIEKQKNTLCHLETIIKDLKNQFPLPRSSCFNDICNEKSPEIITQGSNLHEELKKLLAKYDGDGTSSKEEESESRRKSINPLNGKNLDKPIELSFAKENFGIIKYQLSLYDEVLKAKDSQIMSLTNELEEIKGAKKVLDEQNLVLKANLKSLTEENDYLKRINNRNETAITESFINSIADQRVKTDFSTKEKFDGKKSLKSDRTDYGSITDAKIKNLQQELLTKNKVIDELTNLKNELKAKINSLEEKKQLSESLISQNEDLKRQIKILEIERDNSKRELAKTNENFIKLTNKYVELTDILANQKVQKSPIRNLNMTTSSRNYTASSCNSPINKREEHAYDFHSEDIDVKLKEFINHNKLQSTLFIKIEKGVYFCQSKKLNISLINGKLNVRVGGGGATPLLTFLKNNKIIEEKNLNTSIISNMNTSTIIKSDNDFNGKILDMENEKELGEDKCLTASFSKISVKSKENTPNVKSNSSRVYNKEVNEKQEKTPKDDTFLKGLNENMSAKTGREKDAKDLKMKRMDSLSKSIEKKNFSQTSMSTSANFNNSSVKNKSYKEVSPLQAKKSSR